MKTPEGYEKDEIDKYLKSIGAFVHKTFTGGFGKSGASDRYACIEGRFWAIEVKREGKETPTTLQKRRMDEVEAAGGMVVCGAAGIVIGTIQAWLRNKR